MDCKMMAVVIVTVAMMAEEGFYGQLVYTGNI